uniref:Uncharacterized protein n=1 Tax=Rhizophora mucronata TaxID=61149 RepID=A0A2P2N4F2_RHIMU
MELLISLEPRRRRRRSRCVLRAHHHQTPHHMGRALKPCRSHLLRSSEVVHLCKHQSELFFLAQEKQSENGY